MDSRDSDGHLAELAERYWRFQCHSTPLYAALAGEALPDPVLFRESVTDHERRYRTAGDLLAELHSVDRDGLEPQDRATYALMEHELEHTRTLFEVHDHLRPLLFPTGPAMITSYFANATTIDGAETAERYVDRLATVPGYLADLEACLRAGHDLGIRLPSLVLGTAAHSLRAAVREPAEALPWFGPFARSPVAEKGTVRRQADRALALIADELVPAFLGFAGALEGPISEGARDTVSCTETVGGREFYRTWVREYTNSDMTPEAVHQLGLAEVERLHREMEAIARDAGFGSNLVGFREHLAGSGFIAESGEALRTELQALCKTIDGRIPTFFGRIPRMTYGVESMPQSVAERMPLAYAQPNPGDRSAPGIFWITSLPAKCPSAIHVPTALHEAWPGHLMHIALIQEAEHLPAFRRHGAIRYPACIEGWAIYCEKLGIEMGLYEAPHQHYGRLEMEIWRALRLVVDTGIHWYGWSRERAVDTMARSMAMARPGLEAEVDRYICWPGQALAYQIGNLEFRRLRHLAESRLGESFRARDFHDELLSAGAVSLPVLRDLVERWLDNRLRETESEAARANG